MSEYGYAGQILKVNLSSRKTTKQPSAEYTDRFIGGHGVAARLYWEMVPPQTKPFDPENCLITATGPIAGFRGFAGSRWKVCGMTPLSSPGSFSYCNLGERWGSVLKFAGYDALAVQGKADKPVYIYIRDGKVEIRDATHLRGLSTFDTSDKIKAELGKGVSVLAIGPAGENLIPFSVVIAEGNASGSGGLGAVMGSKNLKAIAVAGNRRPVAADPDMVCKLAAIIKAARPKRSPSMWGVKGLTRRRTCYGCGIGCSRERYKAEKDRNYKALCQSSNMYIEQATKYNKGRNDGAHLLATRLCDGYGLDSIVMQATIEFLEACYLEGIIDEKKIGLPLSKIGSPEFIRELTRVITFKEGFGASLARGVIDAADSIGPRAKEMLPGFVATRGSEKKDYDPRILITTALCYATEPRRPIQQLHEIAMLAMTWHGMEPGSQPGTVFSTADFRRVAEKIWGSAQAADFSTYEGKALAAKKLQDRVFAKECLIVCDLRWTMTQAARALGTSPDTVTESQIYSAITGRQTDQDELWKLGERVFNLQRAILLRQGWQGCQGDGILDYFFTEPVNKGELFFNPDCLMPGKDGELICKEGAVLDRNEFEKMKTEYYGYRGWDADTGLPTIARLEELQLKDVAIDLKKRGLTK